MARVRTKEDETETALRTETAPQLISQDRVLLQELRPLAQMSEPGPIPGRAKRWVPPIVAALIAMALTLPALETGFSQDDNIFRMVFKGAPGLPEMARSPLDTYTFSTGGQAENEALMERGVLPWWTAPGWRVNFLRPVASLGSYLDYCLFGDVAWPMHLHSVLLYGLVILAVGALYLRLMPAPRYAFGFAVFLFAMDAVHGMSVGWLSHRNSLYGVLFGLLALWAHDRWRRGDLSAGVVPPKRTLLPYAPLSWGFLVLALLSAESSVGIIGYFVAYGLILEPEFSRARKAQGHITVTWKDRLRGFRGVAGPFVVAATWWTFYSVTRHGASGSWFYVDPMRQPAAFLDQLVHYYPVLLLGLLAAPESLFYSIWTGNGPRIHLVGAVLFTLAVACIAWPLIRRSSLARFFCLGMLVSIIPLCATMPTDRLLQIPCIGGMGFIGLFLAGVFSGAEWVPRRRIAKGACVFLAGLWILLHLVISPISLTLNACSVGLLGRIEDQANASVPPDAVAAGQRIIVISTPLDLMGASFPISRSANEKPVPNRYRYLYAGPSTANVLRIDARTLRIQPKSGFFVRPVCQLFRHPETQPMHAGDRVSLSGMTAQVVSLTKDGRPDAVDFRFDTLLEDPSFRWLTWDDGVYVAFQPPSVGQSMTVPGLELKTITRAAFGD